LATALFFHFFVWDSPAVHLLPSQTSKLTPSTKNSSRLGECQVCNKSIPARYKCPACTTPYCSLVCFKVHKESCQSQQQQQQQQQSPALSENITQAAKLEQPAIANAGPEDSSKNAVFERLLRDDRIRYYLKQESLRVHLRMISKILEDSKVSGEQSSEARRRVALKKLRELRMGGREENVLVEEFVERVLELLDDDDDNDQQN
jgi:hypothetical protein